MRRSGAEYNPYPPPTHYGNSAPPRRGNWREFREASPESRPGPDGPRGQWNSGPDSKGRDQHRNWANNRDRDRDAADRSTTREEPGRTIFVRNIPYEAGEDEILRLCQPFGDIKRYFSLIPRRGMAFVAYFDVRAAMQAIDQLKGTRVRGRMIDTHYSLPKTPEEAEAARNASTVFVKLLTGGQSITLDRTTLCDMFGKWGDIKETRGCGGNPTQRFVEYYDIRAAILAIEQGKGMRWPAGGTLDVRPATGRAPIYNQSAPAASRRSLPPPPPQAVRDPEADWERDAYTDQWQSQGPPPPPPPQDYYHRSREEYQPAPVYHQQDLPPAPGPNDYHSGRDRPRTGGPVHPGPRDRGIPPRPRYDNRSEAMDPYHQQPPPQQQQQQPPPHQRPAYQSQPPHHSQPPSQRPPASYSDAPAFRSTRDVPPTVILPAYAPEPYHGPPGSGLPTGQTQRRSFRETADVGQTTAPRDNSGIRNALNSLQSLLEQQTKLQQGGNSLPDPRLPGNGQAYQPSGRF